MKPVTACYEDLRREVAEGSNTVNQKRFVVVRFKKTDDLTYDSLHEHVRLGHLELKERYERGLVNSASSDKRYVKERHA